MFKLYHKKINHWKVFRDLQDPAAKSSRRATENMFYVVTDLLWTKLTVCCQIFIAVLQERPQSLHRINPAHDPLAKLSWFVYSADLKYGWKSHSPKIHFAFINILQWILLRIIRRIMMINLFSKISITVDLKV